MLTKNKLINIFPLVLFLLFLPLITLINFSQNDDWVYRENVSNFSKGVFTLNPITAPTFYTQGFIALPFYLFFGSDFLPILTFGISCLCVFILHILLKRVVIGSVIPVLLSLLLFFNPLFLYSSLGFMSENYYLVFALASFFFFLRNPFSKSGFLLANIMFLLAFFTRQIALVIPISFFITYIFSKKYKYALVQILTFALVFLFYTLLFPTTSEMLEKPLSFTNFAEYRVAYSLFYSILIYLSAFTIPLMFSSIITIFGKKSRIVFLIASLCVALYLAINYVFKPSFLAWGEFPYLENVFERKGFYPRGIHGTKYHFMFMYDLYKYWDLVAKILIPPFVLATIVSIYKHLKKPDYRVISVLSYIAVYISVLLLTKPMYDRYVLGLVPFFIIFCSLVVDLKSRFVKIMVVSFLIGLSYLSTIFCIDFVKSNRYVWDRSIVLSDSYGNYRKDIQGTNSWKLTNPNIKRDYKYIFSYDSSEINSRFSDGYHIVEVRDITFPGSIFVNPKIYLYEKNTQ